MLVEDSEVDEEDWAECPGERLTFSPKEDLTVAEITGAFFSSKEFVGFWAPMASATLTLAMHPLHEHEMQQTSRGSGWGCDGRQQAGGSLVNVLV